MKQNLKTEINVIKQDMRTEMIAMKQDIKMIERSIIGAIMEMKAFESGTNTRNSD